MARKDPRADAEAYLEKHNMAKLFEHLGTALVYSQPENPRAFLIDELKRLKACRADGRSHTLFSDQDLATMFTMFDRTGKGEVSGDQFAAACRHVGLESSVPAPAAPITQEVFVKALKEAIAAQKL